MRTRSVIPVVAALALAAPLLAATPAAAAPHQRGLHLEKVQYNSPGDDDRSDRSLNAEWVEIHNNGRSAIQLKGYKLKDNQNYTYTFGSFKLGAGKKVKVHTGKGTNTSAKRHWGRGSYVWNNGGDKARLLKPNGSPLDSCSWGRGTTIKNCY
ncbi:lamin tail domain-containing protein [Streptomyces sp. NPDC127068]|uniref:lamin tail domain-containing protein n=1 Tax=Streptomyces sp. NPDC127068 TaxID=3347127 RepID=UPI00366065F2